MSERPESETLDLLRRLTLAPGPPGAESAVAAILQESLAVRSDLVFSRDRLGSVIIEKAGGAPSPRVLLDAHLDEVGFMVQNINDDGSLSFVTLGGWWGHVLLAQRVDILTENGVVPGVVASKPPHFLSQEERQRVQTPDKMFIDTGASSREEVESFGLRIGDPIVPHAEFLPMANPRHLSSKAFDDRAGVALLVEILLALGDDHPNTVVGVGAVQEEIGCRGAGTAAELARPDVGIILEGTPADDSPGFPSSGRQAALDAGPQIRFFDPTAISNRNLVRLVQEVAAERDIDCQIAVRRGGGTDAKPVHLHGAGVPTVVIGVPSRYIHTHVSIVSLDDFFASRELVLALVQVLDEERVKGL